MKKYEFASIGHGGHSLYIYGHSGYTSGYETKINDRVCSDMVDGGLILDKAAINVKDMVSESVNGPMLGVNLDREGNDKCPVPNDILLSGLSGSFKVLAQARANDNNFKGLDCVGVAIYVKRWLRVAEGKTSRPLLYIVNNGIPNEISYEDAYEFMPQLLHLESHFWGKVSIWKFRDNFQVRWGGNGWYPKIYKFDNKDDAFNEAARLSWEAYNDHEMKYSYGSDSKPKLNKNV